MSRELLLYFHWYVIRHCVILQGIVPESALSSVKELFISDDLKAAAIKEAERLPRLDITQVNLHHCQSLTRHWDEYMTSQQSV